MTFIAERRPPIGDATPALPGAEWKPAGDGGWNLWDRLPDEGSTRRWRYFDRLTADEWEAIKNQHGAEVRSDDQDFLLGDNLGDPDLAARGEVDDVKQAQTEHSAEPAEVEPIERSAEPTEHSAKTPRVRRLRRSVRKSPRQEPQEQPVENKNNVFQAMEWRLV